MESKLRSLEESTSFGTESNQNGMGPKVQDVFSVEKCMVVIEAACKFGMPRLL